MRHAVHKDALQRIDLALPGPFRQRLLTQFEARFHAQTNAAGREIDVLGLILIGQVGGHQTHDVHHSAASPGTQRLGMGVARQLPGELADDVAQMVQLLLPFDVRLCPAGKLDVFQAALDVPDALRFVAMGFPQAAGEDQ